MNHRAAFDEYAKSMRDKLEADSVVKKYVPFDCKRADDWKDHLIDQAVNIWCNTNSARVLAILGNYGSGKTVICKKVCYDLCEDFVFGKNSKVLPIFIEAKSFSSKKSLFELQDFTKLLKKYCPVFSTTEKDYSFVIILDDLDELPTKNKRAAHLFLTKLLATKQKVILTCRTNYFESEPDCLTFLSTAIQEGLNLDSFEAAKSELELKYIAEFTQSHIQDFIKKNVGDPDWNPFFKIFWTNDLEDLSKTPIMLGWLLKILPKINEKRILSRDLIYRSLISSWLKRDCWRGANQEIIIELMKKIAEDMILGNITEISSSAFSDKIRRECGQKNFTQLNLEDLDSMVRLSGFLSRDLNGNLSFIHRSIMEYFFAKVLQRKIKENQVILFKDDEHLLYPESGGIAFGFGPGFSTKNANEPILDKINQDKRFHFSEVCPLSRGFIELLGSILAREKATGDVAQEIYYVFREKQLLRKDENVLYSDAEVMKGNKRNVDIEPRRQTRAYKRVTAIGGEGRIYYNFNVYNFSLIINGQDIYDKWGILVSKTRSWIHT
jgi:hypothetical protein